MATPFKIAKVVGTIIPGTDVMQYEIQLTRQVTDLGTIIRSGTTATRKVLHATNVAMDYALSLVGKVTPVAVLPTLPDPYWTAKLVFLTTDGKLYRNPDGLAWTRAIDGAAVLDGGDILANSLTAGAIAAGAIGAEAIAAGAITTEKLDLRDEYGSTILNAYGFGGAWDDFISRGIYNNAFGSSTVGSADTYPIPYWPLTRVGATAASSATVQALTTGSFRNVRLAITATSGAASDEIYLEQWVPVVFDSGLWRLCFSASVGTSNNDMEGFIRAQKFKADQTTAVGAETDNTVALTPGFGSNALDLDVDWDTAWVRVRVGIRRNTAATNTAGSWDLWMVYREATLGTSMAFNGVVDPLSAPSRFFRGASGIFVETGGHYWEFGDEGWLVIDGDANLWRAAAAVLKTDGQFIAEGGMRTKVKAGTVNASDFADDADGNFAIDTTNHRFYYSEGGVFHYIDRTAGFGIPIDVDGVDERICPKCNEPMAVGDAVAGILDGTASDGALHGRWAHLACAGL